MTKVNYDEEHDILYIFVGEPRVGYEDEVSQGLYLRFAEETGEIIGAIIMDYKKRRLITTAYIFLKAMIWSVIDNMKKRRRLKRKEGFEWEKHFGRRD